MMQKALLVDDSKSARIIISRLLQKHGLEVVTAESGEKALEILLETAPDLIFMDYMMPGLNGIETMHKVHATPNMEHIPVVICTGNEGDSYEEEAMREGASSMLSKPPSAEGIQKAMDDIQKVLDQRAAAASAAQPASMAAQPTSVDDVVIQQAVDRAVAQLREEFDQKLVALRAEMANSAPTNRLGDEALNTKFLNIQRQIEMSKKEVFEAIVKRMQQQQARLLDTIKAILGKQRADTVTMIKRAIGGG
jgi:CheY-like chemotaxis protein